MRRVFASLLLLVLTTAGADIRFTQTGGNSWECVEVTEGRDVHISWHNDQHKAEQCALNAQMAHPEREFHAKSHQRIRFSNVAEAQVFGDSNGPTNSSPIWVDTPTPTAVAGIASSYSLTADFSEPDGDSVTLADGGGCTLPAGVTVDNANNELDFSNATAAGDTTGCTLTVDDGNGAITSPAFTISITITDERNADYTACTGGGCDFTTVQACINALSGGEVCEVQAATPGGTALFDEQLTIGSADGDSDNLTELRGRDGDTIILYADSGGAGDILTLSDDHYWKFKRLQFGRAPPDSGWTYGFTENDGRFGVEHRRWLQSLNDPSSFIIFEDTVSYGGRAFDGGYVDQDASHFAFIRHQFWYAGVNNGGGDPDRDGNTLSFLGSNSIFVDVTGKFGGHDNLSVESPYIVVRGGSFDGSWTDFDATNPGRGNRAFTNEGTRGQSPWGPNVIEKNLIRRADFDQGADSEPCGKFTSFRGIVRRNYLIDCPAGPAYNQTGGFAAGVQATNNIHIYNNTADGNRMVYESRDNRIGTAGDGQLRELVFKNNIDANLGLGSGQDNSHIRVIRSVSDPAGGDPDDWRLSVFENNIFHTSNTFRVVLGPNSGGTAAEGEGNVTGLATVQSTWPDVFSGNTSDAPSYVAQGDRESENYSTAIAAFQLAPGSDGFGDAAAHTQADGAGATSTSLIVDDAAFWAVFNDPDTFDLGVFVDLGYIPPGDCVWVDSWASPVRVTDIDYGANRLTLATAQTWSDNDDVWVADNDDCTTVLDNRGAWQ